MHALVVLRVPPQSPWKVFVFEKKILFTFLTGLLGRAADLLYLRHFSLKSIEWLRFPAELNVNDLQRNNCAME